MINAPDSIVTVTERMTPLEDENLMSTEQLQDCQSESHGSCDKMDKRSVEQESTTILDEDEEWSKLRCGSLCTEELARKEKQKEERRNRQNRCSDYPGFAFGSAMFGSDTTMKFNIIKNELHNIMRSQLKRVDGEVNALSSRIRDFDKKLEESEKLVREATSTLAEAVELQIEESKNKSEEDENQSNLSAFDQHVLFLEAQLKEAKVKASQSFQILEDCMQEQQILLGSNSSSSSGMSGQKDFHEEVLDRTEKYSTPTEKKSVPSQLRDFKSEFQETDDNDNIRNERFLAQQRDNNNVPITQHKDIYQNTQQKDKDFLLDSDPTSQKSSFNSQLYEANNNLIGSGNVCRESDLNANVAGPI